MWLHRLAFDGPKQVRAYVTVLDELGGPLPNKPASAFHLLIDAADMGTASSAVSFLATREPIFVSAVVQTSSSMQPALLDVAKGLQSLCQALDSIPGSQLGVIRFADRAEVVLAAGSGAEARAAVYKLVNAQGEGGQGAVSAISMALGQQRSLPAQVRRMVLFIGDTQSLTDKKALAAAGSAAEQNGVAISSIALGSGAPRPIAELSKRSHGVDRACRDSAEVPSKINELIEEVKQQYVITWKARVSDPSTEHTFQISDESSKPAYSNTLSVQPAAAR